MDYVLTHQECNQKLETETGECGVDGCGDGGGMLYGVGKHLLSFERSSFLFPSTLRNSNSCGFLVYYIVLLLSRACLELLVDEPPLLVEVDRHSLSKSMAT